MIARLPVPQFNTEKKVEEVDDSVDVAALRKRQKQAEEKMVDDGTGKVDIWRIENMARAEWPKNLYGQFFAGDSFIVLYTYKKGTKDAWIIYFWQGKESSTDEKGASALLAKEMDDELGGDPVQVRVVQGKEPPHFLQLFKGKMIVHHVSVRSLCVRVLVSCPSGCGCLCILSPCRVDTPVHSRTRTTPILMTLMASLCST